MAWNIENVDHYQVMIGNKLAFKQNDKWTINNAEAAIELLMKQPDKAWELDPNCEGSYAFNMENEVYHLNDVIKELREENKKLKMRKYLNKGCLWVLFIFFILFALPYIMYVIEMRLK